MSNINIGPNTTSKLLKQVRGNLSKVGATKAYTMNFKKDWNSLIGEGDAEMVIEMLCNKKEYF